MSFRRRESAMASARFACLSCRLCAHAAHTPQWYRTPQPAPAARTRTTFTCSEIVRIVSVSTQTAAHADQPPPPPPPPPHTHTHTHTHPSTHTPPPPHHIQTYVAHHIQTYVARRRALCTRDDPVSKSRSAKRPTSCETRKPRRPLGVAFCARVVTSVPRAADNARTCNHTHTK